MPLAAPTAVHATPVPTVPLTQPAVTPPVQLALPMTLALPIQAQAQAQTPIQTQVLRVSISSLPALQFNERFNPRADLTLTARALELTKIPQALPIVMSNSDLLTLRRNFTNYDDMLFNAMDILTLIGFDSPKQALYRFPLLGLPVRFAPMPVAKYSRYTAPRQLRAVTYDEVFVLCKSARKRTHIASANALLEWLHTVLPEIMTNSNVESFAIAAATSTTSRRTRYT